MDLADHVREAEDDLRRTLEHLGYVEARYGRDSDEYREAYEDYKEMHRELDRATDALEALADTWTRLQEEYLP